MEILEISERRTKPRVETKVRVKIGGQDADVETFTGNLSKSGIFLETSEPFAEVGEKIQMQLIGASSADSIKVTGKVARLVGPNRIGSAQGIALEFLKIEARQARQFERFLDHLLEARGLGCRRYPRAKTRVVVELKSQASIRKVISDNFSNGGIFLKTSIESFALGDPINLLIIHPSSKRKFSVDGEVVHLRAGQSDIRKDFAEGVGVRFTGLSPSRRGDMALFLRNILSAQRKR